MNYLLPSLAGFSSIFVGATFLYGKIRQIIPVKVNCWFCNEDSKVLLKNRNGFVCRFCHQYNGFREDGDYNCDIPAQYNEDLNSSWGPHSKKYSVKNNQSPYQNGLCQLCNLNQALKVRALSDFSPVDESNFDDELEEFRKRLEDLYGLCRQCEAVLHQTLGKQNSWLKPKLISWRLEHSKRLLIKGVSYVSRKPVSIRISNFILFLFSLLLIISYIDKFKLASISTVVKNFFPSFETYYLLFKGHTLLIQNAAVFIALLTTFGKENLQNSDICCCFSWTLLLISSSFKTLLEDDICNLLQFGCSIAAFLATIWAASSPPLNSKLFKTNARSCNNGNYSLDKSHIAACDESAGFENSDLLPHTSVDGYQNDVPNMISAEVNKVEKEAENHDLGATLDSLKISTPKKRVFPDNFNPKSLFTERDLVSCKSLQGNLLTPSRLGNKIVTQSSWVAGGYWGNTGSPQRLTQKNISHFDEVKRPLFSLSRSSSQSSGFVSHLSEKTSSDSRNPFQSFPNSCQSSLCGDKDNTDRASVLSEPILNLWNANPSEGTTSLPSLNRQSFASLDAHSACSTYSQFSSASQNSPSANATMYYNPLNSSQNPSVLQEVREHSNRDPGLFKYCNPWMAFILGLSISANVFLFLIVFKMDTLKSIKL